MFEHTFRRICTIKCSQNLSNKEFKKIYNSLPNCWLPQYSFLQVINISKNINVSDLCTQIQHLELELIRMLQNESIDVIFLTETDTRSLEKEESYGIKGYCTVFPERKTKTSKIRIIGLIKDSLMPGIKIRRDLMSEEFPSIWIEVNNFEHKPMLIGGFYSQW